MVKLKSPLELPPIRIALTMEVATGTPVKYKWTPNYSPVAFKRLPVPRSKACWNVSTGGLGLNEHDTRTNAGEVCNSSRSLLGLSSLPESRRFLPSTLLLRLMRCTDKSKLARLATQGDRSQPDCSNSATAPRERCLISTLFPKLWEICSSFN